MKLKALFDKLAKKAGIDLNSDEYKAITIPDVEVPDETATGIEKGLFNLDAAKNNSDIRKALRTETLNGVDKIIEDILEEYGIDSADDVKGEKNSFEKIKKLTAAVKTTEEKKGKSGTKTEKAEYDKQIADLNKAIKDLKDAATAKDKEFETTRATDLTNYEIQSLLMGKDYALPKEMGAKLKLNTAKAAIDEMLQNKGFKIVRNENGTLALQKSDGTPAYSETNDPIELNSFIDGALAHNKLLKVNDPNPTPGQGNNQQPVVPGNSQQQAPAAYQQGMSELDSMIAAAAKA